MLRRFGRPDLLAGTNIILAVNSYVTNSNCAGVTYSNRVDLQDIQDFIASVPTVAAARQRRLAA